MRVFCAILAVLCPSSLPDASDNDLVQRFSRLKPTISVDNVSKRFYIRREHYRSFQDLFINVGNRRNRAEEFWALRDVSLKVNPGETVGIIGSNGSGKSTLLKLVTRIFEPTSGRVSVSGRVSALLELGAGFHPDLSGRDNVYLNWSLMGLSRKEVDAHFDEIVAFAELEQFIDTPVRLYSSGMYVRLAFSAAIAIKADVLIVDEVLAVGDVAFQEKSFSWIHEAKREGRSVLIVAHALTVLQHICDRVVWLDHGRLGYEGSPDQAISHYLGAIRDRAEAVLEKEDHEHETDARVVQPAMRVSHPAFPCEIKSVRLANGIAQEQHIFHPLEPMQVEVGYTSQGRRTRPLSATVIIRRDDGLEVHRASAASYQMYYDADTSEGRICLRYQRLSLAPGHYAVDVALTPADDPQRFLANRDDALRLVIQSPVCFDQGVVAMQCDWQGTATQDEVDDTFIYGSRDHLVWAPSSAMVAEIAERFLEGDWFPPEGDVESFRWISRSACIYLLAPAALVRLRITFWNSVASTGQGATTLTVHVDDQVVGTFAANDLNLMVVEHDVKLPAAKLVKVTICVDQTARPIDVGLGDDVRELGIAVREVTLEPAMAFDREPVVSGRQTVN